MAKETNISEVMEEVKTTNDDEQLRKTIEDWYERTRTMGMKIGAQYISVAIFNIIQKHIKKQNGAKPSLRDYQRCMDDIFKIISVQLKTEATEQNDLTEEIKDDGTAENTNR